jgi:hypothetical protein
MNGEVRVLRNTLERSRPTGEDASSAAHATHWLGVRLRGRGKNTQGLGARVHVEWQGGGAWREVRTSGGFQAAIPAQVHVGLGAHTRAKAVTVHWPSGAQSRIEDVAGDQVLILEEPGS